MPGFCISCKVKVSRENKIKCRKCEDTRRRIEWPKGHDNWNWKGSKAGYNAKHRWLDRNFGKKKLCENCGDNESKFFDWANISGEYKRNRSDYKRLCRSCHIKFDRRKRKECSHGHKLILNNIIIEKNDHYRCRECKKIKDRKYYLNHRKETK